MGVVDERVQEGVQAFWTIPRRPLDCSPDELEALQAKVDAVMTIIEASSSNDPDIWQTSTEAKELISAYATLSRGIRLAP